MPKEIKQDIKYNSVSIDSQQTTGETLVSRFYGNKQHY